MNSSNKINEYVELVDFDPVPPQAEQHLQDFLEPEQLEQHLQLSPHWHFLPGSVA